ncbi:MAG TPA: cytochrome P450 [Solirubrobacteraceae bacterium]|jgi:cytochrome P450|nr:cytochrome P450 [Solirubrobacteraceae bacterium]
MTGTTPSRVADWDPYDPAAVADPRASWRTLRDACPVAWSERSALTAGGFWAISRYDDVVSLAVAADRFNNSGGPQFGQRRPPLEVDRPEHTFYRRTLQPYFDRGRVAALEPRVRGFVAEMLAPVVAAGGGDLAAHLTYPLPARVLCAWLGLPDAEWEYLKRAADDLFDAEEGRGNDPATVRRCAAELDAYSRRLVDERARRPRDPDVELISGILGRSDGEHTITPSAAARVVRLLLVAGHNATTSALGNCILRLAGDHALQSRLRSQPDLIPRAIDELLRLDTPVQAVPRWAGEDAEVAGQPVQAGEKPMLHLASANRDPDRFPDPDACILDRRPNPHLAFGRGIHRCIGKDLAYLELRVACEELLARTGRLSLAGTPARTTFVRQGVSYLPVTLGARR